ncbi:hypothetical protein E2C01_005033 [Portunus trituberculatus]|uniref:Uncharacterized protein n=1 Tax=Portunus trituberculatus TaxID=210409 RepID=A0A5B7CUI6_PORTR|nr:hypothetical protein [Portunus trituberculatus]
MSDHHAVTCILDAATLPVPPPPPPRFNTRKADWPRFTALLTTLLQTLQPSEDLDEQERNLAQAFHTAAMEAIPVTSYPRRTCSDYWFRDKRMAEMNARLNTTRKLFKKRPTEANRTLLKSVIRHANRVKAEVREEKWIDWCRSLDSHSSLGAMWRKLRTIRGLKPPALPDAQGEAERLAAHFAGRTADHSLTEATKRTLDGLKPDREEYITSVCEEQHATDTPFVPHELTRALKTNSSDTFYLGDYGRPSRSDWPPQLSLSWKSYMSL